MNLAERIQSLAATLDTLRAEIADLDALPEPTEEQTARYDAALSEWDTATAEHAALVARHERAQRALATPPAQRESGFGGAPEVMTRRSPFDGIVEGLRSGLITAEDLRERSLTAIEQVKDVEVPDSFRERASFLASRQPGIARHILLTGSPDYFRGFRAFLRGSYLEPDEARALEAARAALSTTNANGGYLLPFLLDPTVILTSDGSANPFRQISRVETGTTNKWNGITSAGVTAEWKAEGSAATDKSPTFGQPSVTALTGMAFIQGSYEVFQDTDVAAQLPLLVQDAKDNLEATAFATGAGSTTAPKGIVTAVTAVTASRVSPTTAGTFTVASRADVDAVIEAVPPRHRAKSSWIADYATYGIIRRMDTYGGSSFWANLGANVPAELLGRPVYEASAMVSACTTGSNLLLAGNFAEYLIYDRVGVSIEAVPNMFDATTGLPTGQRGYAAWWRTGADCLNPNAFRVLVL